MTPKVAINGTGRIGRTILKILIDTPEVELVAVNLLQPPENLAYSLKYDSVYGRENRRVVAEDFHIYYGDKRFRVFNEKNPDNLPWGDLGVNLVFECTGVFRHKEELEKHLKAGAQHVLLSSPPKGNDIPVVVPGANTLSADQRLRSVASCTTNCVAPVVEVMQRRIGVKKAALSTIHAYTSSQELVDKPKNGRRGRAAATNFVPTTTGAAEATTKIVTSLQNKFDGIAIRGPVPAGSLTDITFVTIRPTTVDEVNNIFKEEAESDRYHGILGVTTDPIVSSDIIKDPRASLVDLQMTRVIDGDLVKVMSWYDNEWGYSQQMVREALTVLGLKKTK